MLQKVFVVEPKVKDSLVLLGLAGLGTYQPRPQEMKWHPSMRINIQPSKGWGDRERTDGFRQLSALPWG